MKTWPAALLVLAAAPLLAAPQQPVEERRAAARDGLVEIENGAGSVQVVGWDRAEVTVSGILGKGARGLQVRGDARRTRVEVLVQGDPNGVRSELEVHVPAGSRVSVESFGASISVAGVTGSVRAESVNGNIAVANGPHEVRAESVNGAIEVTAHANRVRAESVTGAVTVKGATGEIDASTVTGPLALREVAFERGRLETISGSIHFDGSLSPKGWLEVQSVSGTVELVLPSRIAADFKISTFSGELKNELERVAQAANNVRTKELSFSTAGGGAKVNVETLSGMVVVRRR